MLRSPTMTKATSGDAGRLLSWWVVLGSLLLVGACAPTAPDTVTITGSAFGTTWTLSVVDLEHDADPDELRGLIDDVLARVDLAASNWREDSELAAAGQLAPDEVLEVSEELVRILDAARDVHDASGGAFDPTVGPLVGALGFGADASESPADEATLAAARARLGFDAFAWADGQLTRSRPEVTLDLSGVAKGSAVDFCAEELLARGENRFLLEVGGEVRVAGTRETGTPWVLGIFEPIELPAIHGSFEATDLAIATSGDYRTFRTLDDGTRLSHTIDPRSGRASTSRVASVTILAPECGHADALATAVMVLGPVDGLDLVERTGGVEAYLLVHGKDGFEVVRSSGFPAVTRTPR